MDGLIADPWVIAQIDAAVAPYVGRLPAEEIAWMRERLAESLATEAAGRDLVRRARPRAVERSGEVLAKGAAAPKEPIPLRRIRGAR